MSRKIAQIIALGALVIGIPSIALAAGSPSSADDCCCPLCCHGK